MKQLYFIIILTITSQLVIAQNSAYPDLPFTGLHQIVVEGNNIIAVGTCDKAIYSNDGGATWNYMDVDIDVSHIAMIPGTNGREIVMIDRDELYKLNTEDQSVTSTGITSNGLISGRFEGMHVKNENIILIGAISILQATLSEMNFTKVGDLEYPSSDLVGYTDITDNYVWVGTRKGLVFKGDLSTNTLSEVYNFGVDLRNLAMGTDDVGYTSLSGESNLYKTLDGGVSWMQTGSFSEISTLYAYGEDIVISRNTNRLVVSTDGGITSEYVSYMDQSGYSYLSDLTFLPNGDIYMAGESSTVLKSSDYGKTFENINLYQRESIFSIDMNDDGIGLAVGGSNHVVSTVDGGDNWTRVNFEINQPNSYLDACVVTDEGVQLILNDEGIHKLENGVSTKISDEVLTNIMYLPNDGSFIGFKYQGGSYLIRKSVDGGLMWETTFILNDYGYSQAKSSTGTIIISVNEDEYAISVDYGDTWEIKPTPFQKRISSVALFGESHGLVTFGNDMYKTEDKFETFTKVSTGYAQSNIQMYSEMHYIFTSAQNSITTVKESTDGGESWIVADSYCSQSYSATLQGDNYWMGQRGGHINSTKLDLSSSTKDDIVISELTIKNNILQNGDNLSFEFDEPIYGQGEIVDQNGRSVQQFNSRNESAFRLNINGLESGIYFLRVIGERKIYQGKIVVVN